MHEEEYLLKGEWFAATDEELMIKKRKAHRLSQEFNATFEDETDKCNKIIKELLVGVGEGCSWIVLFLPLWLLYPYWQ